MKKVLLFAVLMMAAMQGWCYDFSAVAPSGQTLYYNIVNDEAHVVRPDGYTYNSYVTGDLTIPSSVTYNGTTYSVTALDPYDYYGFVYGTFQSCSGLTSVTIPESVTSIGQNAFRNCTGLPSVDFPSSLTSIGDYAFYGCTSLEWAYLPEESVTSIGDYAFYGCTSLEWVDLPESVTSIGIRAFSGCSNLYYIYLTSSVTSIGSYAFSGCISLTSVTIPDSVTSIGSGAFSGCSGLTSIAVDNGNSVYDSRNNCNAIIETTTNKLIQGCNNTIIPNTVTSIDDYAFRGSGLTSVTIPNSVTSIGSYAFYDCSGLTSVTIGSSVTSIGSGAFYDCSGLTSITIPNSVTSIGDYVFYGCSGLTSVTIGSSVTSIGSYAFKNCTGLTSVTIPNSVTSIGNSAFYGCSGLTSVTIPNSVTSIGNSAFYGCSGLTSVTIPNSVTSIGSYAFIGCSGLTSIAVANGNSVYDSRNNCNAIIETTTNKLIRGCNNTIIPNTVTSIGSDAFSYCSGLTSITIGSSVDSIYSYAFYGCTSLDTVYMEPSTPPYLGTDVFYNNASGRVFIIAGCAYDNYYNVDSTTRWYNLRNYLHRQTININVTVQSSNTTRGTANVVLGPENHVVRCDSTVVVQATANSNYYFDHWSTGSTANPDTITLVGDSIITAYFLPNQYTITGTSANTARGTVTGSATVDYLDTVTLIAHPNYGYHLDHWTYTNENNNNTSTQNGGDTLTLVANKDRSATAYFNPNQYQLTVNVDNSTHGSVSGGGTYNYNTSHTITATASNGYLFDHWSNGSTANPANITLTCDSTVTAYFERDSCELTIYVNDPSLGTVTAPDGTSGLYGDTLTVVATPIDHHHVASWKGNSIVATSAHKDTVWVRLLDMCKITCNFAIDTHTVAVTSNDIARGNVSATGTEFTYGSPCTVSATAYTGYTFQSWSNGITANPYTFAVLEDVELTAIFVVPGEETYTVSVNVNDPTMGSATVNGNTTATVTGGSEVTLTATPNAGYRFVRWNDDNTEETRTVTVTADMSFTAYFESDGTQGIEDIETPKVAIVINGNTLTVQNTDRETIRIFDCIGRQIATSNLSLFNYHFSTPSGVYFVKVGILPSKKIVVVK